MPFRTQRNKTPISVIYLPCCDCPQRIDQLQFCFQIRSFLHVSACFLHHFGDCLLREQKKYSTVNVRQLGKRCAGGSRKLPCLILVFFLLGLDGVPSHHLFKLPTSFREKNDVLIEKIPLFRLEAKFDDSYQNSAG